MPAGRRKAAVAAEVWRRIFRFIVTTVPQRNAVLERLGLSPNDSRALYTLDAEQGRTMRSLADAWGCDASNATWIVDRLERRGLAERRLLPSDRRVKLVFLTALGMRTKQELAAGMDEPPPALLSLSRADLEALKTALRKLPEAPSSEQPPASRDVSG